MLEMEIKTMAEVGRPRLPNGPKIVNSTPEATVDTSSTSTVVIDDDTIIDPSEDEKEDKKEKGEEFEEIKTRAKIPLPPSKKINFQDIQAFYDWLATLKPEHWVQLTWYMFRVYPKIIRPPQQHYIDCGNYAITEQWVLENHGSGDYMFTVNDSSRPKNAKTICQAYIKNLNNALYPTKLNPAELDTSYPGNRRFVEQWIAEGKLTTDGRPMNTAQQNGGLSDQIILRLIDKIDRTQLATMKDPKDSAINAAFEIIAKGNATATQLMLDQMKQDDPDKLVKLITSIMALAPKPVEHNNNNESMTFMKLIMETQAKNAELMAKKDETIMQMMLKMMEAKVNPTESDGFDKTIDRFLKFTELMGLEGLGGGGKKSTLETVMQYGTPILDRGLGILQNLLALKAQGAPTNQARGQGGQQAQPGQAALPVTTSTAPIVETDGTGQPINKQTTTGRKDPREAMLQQSGEQEEMIKQGLKQIGPKILEALARKTSGDQFAEGIDNFLGPMVYNQLAALGEAKILEILKTDQQLWSQLQTVEPALRQFIQEFIDYGKPEPDGSIIDADDASLNDDSIEAAKGEGRTM